MTTTVTVTATPRLLTRSEIDAEHAVAMADFRRQRAEVIARHRDAVARVAAAIAARGLRSAERELDAHLCALLCDASDFDAGRWHAPRVDCGHTPRAAYEIVADVVSPEALATMRAQAVGWERETEFDPRTGWHSTQRAKFARELLGL